MVYAERDTKLLSVLGKKRFGYQKITIIRAAQKRTAIAITAEF